MPAAVTDPLTPDLRASELAGQVLTALTAKRSTWTPWNVDAEASRLLRAHRFDTPADRDRALAEIVDAVAARAVLLTPPEQASTPGAAAPQRWLQRLPAPPCRALHVSGHPRRRAQAPRRGPRSDRAGHDAPRWRRCRQTACTTTKRWRFDRSRPRVGWSTCSSGRQAPARRGPSPRSEPPGSASTAQGQSSASPRPPRPPTCSPSASACPPRTPPSGSSSTTPNGTVCGASTRSGPRSTPPQNQPRPPLSRGTSSGSSARSNVGASTPGNSSSWTRRRWRARSRSTGSRPAPVRPEPSWCASGTGLSCPPSKPAAPSDSSCASAARTSPSSGLPDDSCRSGNATRRPASASAMPRPWTPTPHMAGSTTATSTRSSRAPTRPGRLTRQAASAPCCWPPTSRPSDRSTRGHERSASSTDSSSPRERPFETA